MLLTFTPIFNSRSARNTLIVSILLWTIIVLVNIPILSINGIYEYQFMMESRSSCTYVAHANRTANQSNVRLVYLSFNVFGYILPFAITCLLYYVMIRRLATAHRNCHSSIRASKDNRMKQKVTRTVTAVIVTFAVCWLPLNICFCLIFAQTLAYANSCLNPILYGFLSEPFRKGFFNIGAFVFCLKRGTRNVRYELAREFRSGSKSYSLCAVAASIVSVVCLINTGFFIIHLLYNRYEQCFL
ncbi:unnamed protein product [Soboliphyme baturini]|uniref:G_PROTEIN_RECEP_F1_2 domain-containing protein n=1 Tax=Soboliphyme baturini TaxID=241478 RepID=A0A183J2Q0_9BILA|nr:unnamed protein product [Soboliphyme baturini]